VVWKLGFLVCKFELAILPFNYENTHKCVLKNRKKGHPVTEANFAKALPSHKLNHVFVRTEVVSGKIRKIIMSQLI